MLAAKDNTSTYTYGSGEDYKIDVTGYNILQIQEYKDANWFGFYNSPEYATFLKLVSGEFVYLLDRKPYDSPYFGPVPQGKFYGENLDHAFELFDRKRRGEALYKNPYLENINTEAQTGGTDTRSINTGTGTGTEASGFPWLLLVAAAAAFALS